MFSTSLVVLFSSELLLHIFTEQSHSNWIQYGIWSPFSAKVRTTAHLESYNPVCSLLYVSFFTSNWACHLLWYHTLLQSCYCQILVLVYLYKLEFVTLHLSLLNFSFPPPTPDRLYNSSKSFWIQILSSCAYNASELYAIWKFNKHTLFSVV